MQPAPTPFLAPAAPPTSGIVHAVDTERAQQRVRGELRDVRAEIQNLHAALRDVKAQCELTDPDVRRKAVETALKQAAVVFAENRPQMEERLSQIRLLLGVHPAIHDAIGDVITQIENAWDRFARDWPESAISAEEVLSRYGRLEANISLIVSHCGLLTIPNRVNEHLRGLRVGQPLDFRKAFEDELPGEEALRKLLETLAAHPEAIEGVIDVEAGTILRAHPKGRGRRLASYLYIATALGLGVAVMYLLSLADTLAGASIPFETWLSGYGGVLAGSVVHLVIDALKQSRKKTGAAFRAVDDWLLWFHVREASIIMSIVAVWVCVAGIGFTSGKVDLATAFFVGYSIDSFIDLFLERFDKHVSTKTTAIQQQLRATP